MLEISMQAGLYCLATFCLCVEVGVGEYITLFLLFPRLL